MNVHTVAQSTDEFQVDYFLDAVGVSIGLLQLGTVILLMAGPARKYAFVLIYCLLQLGTSLAEFVVAHRFGTRARAYRVIFWTDEIVLDLLLFLILILLTYQAMEGSPVRGAMSKMLVAFSLIAVSLPFVIFKGAFVKSTWFDQTSQLLNFAAAILNLGLWMALLRARRRDSQYLAVSAGFGIVATGVAISFGPRHLIHTHGTAYLAANLMFMLAHLGGASILCWAFRPARRRIPGRVSPAPSETISNGAFVP
jgi:hypothetical protein